MPNIITQFPDLIGDLTELMEKVPYQPGLVTDMGLFKKRYTPTTNIAIDITNRSNKVIPEGIWGYDGYTQDEREAETVPFILKQLTLKDRLGPEDLQDHRRPGSNDLPTANMRLAEKMADMKANFALTLEYMQVSALKGVLKGGSGNTIYDYYSQFGVSQKTYTWELTDTSLDVNAKIRELSDYVRKNHNSSGRVQGITVLCSKSFFDSLVNHTAVKTAYENYSSIQEPLRKDISGGFRHQDVDFMVYSDSITNHAGSTEALIADTKAYAFPRGIDIFDIYYGPEYSINGANTMGSDIYLRTEPMKYDMGIEMKGSCTVLPVNKRPEAVVEITAS